MVFWCEPHGLIENGKMRDDLEEFQQDNEDARDTEIDCHQAGNWAGHYGHVDFDLNAEIYPKS